MGYDLVYPRSVFFAAKITNRYDTYFRVLPWSCAGASRRLLHLARAMGFPCQTIVHRLRALSGAHLRAQLQQYPQFVGTAPALHDLAALEPRNLHSAGSDGPTGGRDPSELAVMGAVERIGYSNVGLGLNKAIDRHG